MSDDDVSINQEELKELRIKAGVHDRLVKHLDKRKDVQNIDLMILSGFCRNCLCKWYLAEANTLGLDIDMDEARRQIYGMEYTDWKKQYQSSATNAQLSAFNNIKPEQTS